VDDSEACAVIEWFQAHWPNIVSSIVATAATLGLSYRFFAERLFGHFFDKRLESLSENIMRDCIAFAA
jgi:hypothetical protein